MPQEYDLNKILQIAVKGNASDIHIKAGLPPIFRVDGALVPLRDAKRLSPEDIGKMAANIMTQHQKEEFEKTLDLDMSHGVPGVGRFRVNVFQQRGSIGLVFRVIPFKVLTPDELMLPEVVKTIAEERRGLILVTGATGSGKSTTLASIVDYINRTRTDHIITIEDPIEYLIRDKKSIINQREVGNDTSNFNRAVRAALRQDPDVIMVGEMRDVETIEIALTAAETGHLVLGTLHTIDAAEAVSRVVTAFPPHQRDQARYQFANLFKGVIAQRLIPRADGKGRVPAVEIMIATARIQEMILEHATARAITEMISKGVDNYGMQTFDQSLMKLLQNGLITYEEALAQSTNPDDFALRVSGVGSTSDDAGWANFEGPSGGSTGGGGGDDFDLDEFDIERF
ncbi:type IV pilus twitching motility protein PilT [Persicimonas caeni]|uniref:Type IV pilus twitching motility protein PilT n=1 Tax=Persicimonas caeni TaxID=2292766 RepID=A0A4Y6PYC7_PERCE|nr:type IV pilus twitching motility protein PilT [Persicimonas caeni]QDG53334.1 type IV pilus twitching motility protein PilT [Persicimonas caeni]QED34555.1 type IV pilus twitching motility protein PilT [Persicimonas caeni]